MWNGCLQWSFGPDWRGKVEAECVLDPGKETGAGTVQLGVCETSAEDRHILIRWNSFPLAFTPLIWLQPITGVTYAGRKSFLIQNINQKDQCGRSDPCWSVMRVSGVRVSIWAELSIHTAVCVETKRKKMMVIHRGPHVEHITQEVNRRLPLTAPSHLMDDRNFFKLCFPFLTLN